MSVDREQARRDAEEVLEEFAFDAPGTAVLAARHCLALLAELEQAEADRDDATSELATELATASTEANELEARLAKVPALMEALKGIRDGFDGDEFQDSADASDQHREIARAALAAWESR